MRWLAADQRVTSRPGQEERRRSRCAWTTWRQPAPSSSRQAYFKDPDGNHLILHHRCAPPPHSRQAP